MSLRSLLREKRGIKRLWESRSERRKLDLKAARVRRDALKRRRRRLREDRAEATSDERRERLGERIDSVSGHISDAELEVQRLNRRAAYARTKAENMAKKVRRLQRIVRNRARPKIITAAEQDIHLTPRFGGLGTISYVTGHHTAGPTDADREDAIRLNRVYNDSHRARFGDGIGYHGNIARDGTILPLRPIAYKGAHVGGWNTGNAGWNFHGTTGDRPTRAQQRSWRWLLANAHTDKMPAAHRSPVPLNGKTLRGHNSWSGHESNACPGTHRDLILSGGAKR